MRRADPLVSARFQFEREFLAAGLDDAASFHHMDEVGHDVVEQALVVGDQHDGVVAVAQLIDTVRDDPQRIDVEAGIGLVEDREARLQQRHLQNLVALLLATGEAFIDAAAEKLRAHLEQLHLLAHEVVELERVQFVLATLRLQRVVGHAQKLAVGHAGNLDRVLEREKHTGERPRFRSHPEQILPVELRRACRHRVGRVTCQHFGERALARAVGAHDGVHFTAPDGEVQALEDLDAVDAGAQAAHGQQDRAVGVDHPTLPSSFKPSSWVASTANSMGNC